MGPPAPGKIAASLAAGTVGYANRRTKKAQEVRQFQGQMTLTELDRKHSELLEKLTQANAATLGEMRSLTKEVKTEVADLRKGLQGQLDTHRTETMRLGKELVAMRERQEKMEANLRSAAPSMSDGVPITPKANSSRASARTSRTM